MRTCIRCIARFFFNANLCYILFKDDIQNDYQDKSSIISADDEKDNSEHENDNEQGMK